MLVIDKETYDAIVAHARRDHPDEACGVVAGPAGSDRPERFVPMLNAARSPTFYEFDSHDLLSLYREMDARDEEPVVIYHSHTATEAYPSRTDISLAECNFAGKGDSVLVIRADLVDAMVAHARADHPDEACGVIAGPEGSDRPERFIAMTNAERSPTFYRFDSGEQLKVWRGMDDADEAPVVIYHSHTATEAYPSRTDISYASEPDAHYVLVSTRDPDEHELRSYRILDGVVTEEPVKIVEQY